MITFKAVLPKAFTGEKEQKLQLLNAIRSQARETRRQFQETTKHWETHHPKFKEKIHFAQRQVSFEILIEGSSEDVDVWHYLDKGTEIRHVIMEPDFLSKTLVNQWETRPGVGTAAMNIYPEGAAGIPARNWSDMAEFELSRYKWQYRIQEALRRAALKSGHGGR